ncbi:MAG TPA: NUDIX domain-containing protein [Actinomycetes bacterium]
MVETLPPEPAAVVDLFLTEIDERAPGLVEGLYLHGSLGFGEYHPGRSDVDFVAVLSGRASAADLAALRAAHATVAAAYPETPHLDGIHVLAEDLRRPPADCPDVPTVHEKRFSPAGRFELNPVTWHGLAEHGLTVRGTPISELGVWTDDGILRDFTRANLDTYWRGKLEEVTADPAGASAPWASEWCVLGVARLHHLLALAAMTSKSGAGRYARATFDPRWRPLVEDALAVRETPDRPLESLPYGDGTDQRRGRDIAAFMAWVIDDALTRGPRAVAVVQRGREVLVIKRHLLGRDYAVLPGGSVEPGESFEEAAVRELWEESTLRARVDRQLLVAEHNGREARYFVMADVEGTPTMSGPELEAHGPDNSYELMWASADEFDRLALQPHHLRLDLPALLQL